MTLAMTNSVKGSEIYKHVLSSERHFGANLHAMNMHRLNHPDLHAFSKAAMMMMMMTTTTMMMGRRKKSQIPSIL